VTTLALVGTFTALGGLCAFGLAIAVWAVKQWRRGL
jgi:hypothetical protein